MKNTIYEYNEVKDEKLKKYIIDTPLLHKYFKLDSSIAVYGKIVEIRGKL